MRPDQCAGARTPRPPRGGRRVERRPLRPQAGPPGQPPRWPGCWRPPGRRSPAVRHYHHPPRRVAPGDPPSAPARSGTMRAPVLRGRSGGTLWQQRHYGGLLPPLYRLRGLTSPRPGSSCKRSGARARRASAAPPSTRGSATSSRKTGGRAPAHRLIGSPPRRLMPNSLVPTTAEQVSRRPDEVGAAAMQRAPRG